jgi:diamine N-acetyltransferase
MGRSIEKKDERTIRRYKMKIDLKKVTRDNWEEAIELQVKKGQSKFVPTPSVSLAKVYIKPDGPNVEYLPFAIYAGKDMVGFIMHAYEEHTTDMYWINGFFIDEKYQGNGYGRASMIEMIAWIRKKFKQCKEIRLTVYQDNYAAKKLYKSIGFIKTTQMFGEEEVWRLSFAETNQEAK